MQRDIRGTPVYQEAEALYKAVRRPGTGHISDAVDISAAPGGTRGVFTGALLDKLEGVPQNRIFEIDFSSGEVKALTFGPNTDRLPKYSPTEGGGIAFLSDRHEPGDFQLYLFDPKTGAARATPAVAGWVEYFHWSPDGQQVLLGVAGHGADISGGQGAVTTKPNVQDLPSWIPAVETGQESYRWRSAWIFNVRADSVRQVNRAGQNIWEAVWCGNDAIAAVVSDGPTEGLWYQARLHIVQIEDGRTREVYKPEHQLGWPAASPSGRHLAIVESICSDRWIVAGDVRLIDTSSGNVRAIHTAAVDVAHAQWRSDDRLLLGGHRGFETVIGMYDVKSEKLTQIWASHELTTGGRYVTVSGFGERGDCALIGESFTQAPEVGVIRSGRYQPVRTFDVEYARLAGVIGGVQRVTWSASDGLAVQGWLVLPRGNGPHPTIMNIHGGPVGHWRTLWLGRAGMHFLMLLERGYAVFFPNPRGSVGLGQSFIRPVLGDMGGADAYDLLSGLDHLVARGLADPERLGVMGASYGGFMAAWLITQDNRFAAAIPVAPVTNYVTEHLISNIPDFVSLFLADTYTNPGGKYFERSPVMHAHKVKTPALNICGALDRATPPEEAVQFHNALLENQVESALITYPEEGHGVRKFPALLDYAARVVSWFDTHLTTGSASSGGT